MNGALSTEGQAPQFSLVVATVDRRAALCRLLDSLSAQTRRDFEVIVVDQNEDDRLAAILRQPRAFAVRHLHTGELGGVSAARNVGWREARGAILVFPDDDCWYPADYLERMARLFRKTTASLVTGRATDLAGTTINGRFERRAGSIGRHNAFTTQIEWNMGIRRELMQQLGGYDEAISLGGPTPWQGGEGYDIVLRAVAAGARCRYDPQLTGHHDELPVRRPDAAMIAKGRAYARGLGFVLHKHRYGRSTAAWWIARSLVNLALSALRLRPDRMRYYGGQALGRWEGWAGRA
jgi:glycosyltransferase involved in cell wall biosynthesis